MKLKTAHDYYMAEQEKHPVQFGTYTLPEQWQIDAMETYAASKVELHTKLLDAIKNMIGSVLMRCTYYHKSATFVETDRGKYMIRVEPYDPPKVVLDDVAAIS